jgi:hypothetical protein
MSDVNHQTAPKQAILTDIVVIDMPEAEVYHMTPNFNGFEFIAVIKSQLHKSITEAEDDSYVLMPVEQIYTTESGITVAKVHNLMGHIECGESVEDIFESFEYSSGNACGICGQTKDQDNCQG